MVDLRVILLIIIVCQVRTTAMVTWRGNTVNVTTASVNTVMENTANMGDVEGQTPTTTSQ